MGNGMELLQSTGRHWVAGAKRRPPSSTWGARAWSDIPPSMAGTTSQPSLGAIASALRNTEWDTQLNFDDVNAVNGTSLVLPS